MTETITLDPAFNLDEDERRIILEALKLWWEKAYRETNTHDLLIANRLVEMFSNP